MGVQGRGSPVICVALGILHPCTLGRADASKQTFIPTVLSNIVGYEFPICQVISLNGLITSLFRDFQ